MYLHVYLQNKIMRKLADKNTRKITKVGKTSLAVTIPKEMITELGWREKQKVTVKKVHGGVLIKDWKE